MILMNKKLQVFVSSTYTDLIEERQAAVEAILDAGHIPAGMELFKAGKSQMKTIQKWIDDSDVYMLILGGRYGSIEEESGLSYTELEYKYALSKNMPVFAIVLEDSFLFTKAASVGKDTVFEKENNNKYEIFKDFVKTKIVRFADNDDKILSIIHSQLNTIINDNDYNLVGWIRRDSIGYSFDDISKENYNLIHENYKLNKQVKSLQQELNVKKKGNFNNDNFFELVSILSDKIFLIPEYYTNPEPPIKISALKFFIDYYIKFKIGIPIYEYQPDSFDAYIYSFCFPFFIDKNLLMKKREMICLTQKGISFYNLLEIKKIKNNIFI